MFQQSINSRTTSSVSRITVKNTIGKRCRCIPNIHRSAEIISHRNTIPFSERKISKLYRLIKRIDTNQTCRSISDKSTSFSTFSYNFQRFIQRSHTIFPLNIPSRIGYTTKFECGRTIYFNIIIQSTALFLRLGRNIDKIKHMYLISVFSQSECP